MVNVRCPMCSKLNEADADVCAFCGARLKPIRPASPASPEQDSPGGQEEDEPAWLRELRRSEERPSGGAEEPAGSEPEQVDSADWLSRIRETAQEETGPARDLPGGEDEGQPDWMSDLLAGAGPPVDAGLEDDDWLGRLQPDLRAEMPVSDRDEGLKGTGLTDFLAGLEEREASSSAEMPGQDRPVQGEFELPAWEQPASSEAADEPDWLSSMADETDQAAAPAGQDEPIDLPDWLGSDFRQAGMEQSVEPAAPSPNAEEDELPDWFASFTEPEQESQAEQPAAEAGLPGWMGSAEEPAAGVPPEPGQEPAQEPAPVPGRPAAGEAGAAPPGAEDEVPEWLHGFSTSPIEEEEELSQPPAGEADQLFIAGELPEWLSEAAGDSLAEEPPPAAEQPAGEDLAEADLPDWVRDMRPIESVNLGLPVVPEMDQRVEKAGPLAGLRGILPAEDLATRYRKPPVYSARLRISEKQRSQASLLESILEQETQPILIPPARSRAPHLVGRILAALLWLIVLTIPFAIPLGLEPARMRTPPELEAMFRQIDQSNPAGSPVLLAVDFEPGRAGEMSLAARPVVEHLMSRGMPLAIVSTTPAGPVLAESLLDEAAENLASQGQEYDLAAMTVNLGFLPGGTISLLEFARFPRLAAPASIGGDYEVWNQPVLVRVAGLDDFDQVIVITDSAEVGRTWVEQVQPLMGDVPLLIVSSAQAEPMLMPYVDSGQIDGLTGGLLGGVLYSQWRQVEPAAGPYWSSYQVGIGLAFLAVLFGGLVSGGAALLKPGSKDEA